MLRVFATFFEKKGGAKKLSIGKVLVNNFKKYARALLVKVRALFFEASATLAFSCERRGTAQAVDE